MHWQGHRIGEEGVQVNVCGQPMKKILMARLTLGIP